MFPSHDLIDSFDPIPGMATRNISFKQKDISVSKVDDIATAGARNSRRTWRVKQARSIHQGWIFGRGASGARLKRIHGIPGFLTRG